MSPYLYTIQEAAELLSISTSMAYKLAINGELEVVRLGRCLRVRHSSIERIVNGGNDR